MKKEGKKFEEDFKKSVPPNWTLERLKDTGGWMMANTKSGGYTTSNKADFILFTGKTLYYIELKSRKDDRFNLNEKNLEHIQELLKLQNTKINVKCLYLINLRSNNTTFFMACDLLEKLRQQGKKSISASYAEMGLTLPGHKKITRWTYDLSVLQ